MKGKEVKRKNRHSSPDSNRELSGELLCKQGEDGVHTGKSEWHDACPMCGEKMQKETCDNSAIGRELGFCKSPRTKLQSVRSCSSFGWAQHPAQFFVAISQSRKRYPIEDEYGNKYTAKQFTEILAECPIQQYEMIGEEFS